MEKYCVGTHLYGIMKNTLKLSEGYLPKRRINMKKGLYLAMAAVMVFSMTGCSTKKAETGSVVAENMGEMDGSLKSFTNATLVITDKDGKDVSFAITDKAKFSCKNMLAGDTVTVTYNGTVEGTDTSDATVTEVDDKGEPTAPKEQEIVGTLETYSANSLTLKTNDGKQYSFSIVGAKQEYRNGIEPGNWIHITYTGTINGADTSGVKVVKITDDEANTKEEKAKVNIKDVNEKVWATAVVNIRDNYSTDANVLGSLKVNDELTRTGDCDNGWSRVDYNGNTAYVYAKYLTTTAPAAPTQPAAPVSNPQPSQPAQQTKPADSGESSNTGSTEGTTENTGSTEGTTENTGSTEGTTDAPQQTATGFVTDLGVDGVLVIDVDGTDYTFNITNAQQNYANGILVGNEVTVTYVGDLSDSANATVYSVVDSATNTNNQSRITGTIQSASMNGLALVTDDNATLAISTDGATVNCANGILVGEKITVTLDLDKTVDASNMFYASTIDDAQ